jgi:hypothetical protein
MFEPVLWKMFCKLSKTATAKNVCQTQSLEFLKNRPIGEPGPRCVQQQRGVPAGRPPVGGGRSRGQPHLPARHWASGTP